MDVIHSQMPEFLRQFKAIWPVLREDDKKTGTEMLVAAREKMPALWPVFKAVFAARATLREEYDAQSQLFRNMDAVHFEAAVLGGHLHRWETILTALGFEGDDFGNPPQEDVDLMFQ